MRYLLGFLCLLALPAWAQPAPPLYEVSGTTILRWTPPAENVDGTPLTDLDGYRIYWGMSSRDYIDSVDISDEGLTQQLVTVPLDSDNQTTWYFAMTAYDVDGNESAYSNEVRKTLTINVIDNRPPAPPILEEVEMQFTCIGITTDIICTITITDG